MKESLISTTMMPVWCLSEERGRSSRKGQLSETGHRTSGVGLCSFGSSWSLCWTTPPTDTSLPGLAVASSLNSLSQKRSDGLLTDVKALCLLSCEAVLFLVCYWYSLHKKKKKLIPGMCSCIGGSTLGHPEESACHELRQAESISPLLLREGHHAEGKGTFPFQFPFSSFTFSCLLFTDDAQDKEQSAVSIYGEH